MCQALMIHRVVTHRQAPSFLKPTLSHHQSGIVDGLILWYEMLRKIKQEHSGVWSGSLHLKVSSEQRLEGFRRHAHPGPTGHLV